MKPHALGDGGAISTRVSHITFDNNSTGTFDSNLARLTGGGAVNCVYYSSITFDSKSIVTFNSNEAFDKGEPCIIISQIPGMVLP